MLVSPSLCHEVQECLIEIKQIQRNQQFDDLRQMAPRLHEIRDEMQKAGLDGAALLCLSLSELSHVLARKPCQIDFAEGLEVLGQSASQFAEYVSLVSDRIPVSPLILVNAINRTQQLFDIEAITAYDLFRPSAVRLDFAKTSNGARSFAISQSADEKLHLDFRKQLLVYMQEKDFKSLDALLNLLAEVKNHKDSAMAQTAFLVSSCIELGQYQNGRLGLEGQVSVLLSEMDMLLKRLCENGSKQDASESMEALTRNMLFLIGDTLHRTGLGEAVTSRDVGSNTERACADFELDLWFCDDSTHVIREESRKSVELAAELSNLDIKRDCRSLSNLLALHFLGGLDSSQLSGMFAKLDEMQELAYRHDDCVLKAYVIRLCEVISSIDVSAQGFFGSQSDSAIAAAWMMLWEFVETPDFAASERLRCMGQRLGELERIGEGDYSCNMDVNFMRPWPTPELSEARNNLMSEIIADFSNAAGILADAGGQGVDEIRLEEVRSVLGKIECLFSILGCESAVSKVGRVGMLISQAIGLPGRTGNLAGKFVPLMDSIEASAVALAENGSEAGDAESRFDQLCEDVEDWLAGQKAGDASEFSHQAEPVLKQLQKIEAGLERWQENLGDSELAMGIREEFTDLARLSKARGYEDICRICNVAASMIVRESLRTISDSTVMFNLLLEVLQGIKAEVENINKGAQGHLGPMLRMIEKLQGQSS